MERKQLCMAVCDDRPEDVERVQEAMENTMKKMGYQEAYELHGFTEGNELYEAALEERFHLVFLDVEMPGMDGFGLASKLSMQVPGTCLIFISNYEHFVFDSYEYAPLWFIRKSALEQDMYRAMYKYMQQASWMRLTCRLKDGHTFKEVNIGDILYVEYMKHTLIFRTVQGLCLKKYGSLRSLEEDLAPYGFLRVHKNYLVNQRYVQKIERQEVLLYGDLRVEMGRDRKKMVCQIMHRYGKN